MRVYTYSEARQRLASPLDQSRREGKVQIRRRDGQLFVLQPAAALGSPLDVPAVKAKLRPGELGDLIREGRESANCFWVRRCVTDVRSRRVGSRGFGAGALVRAADAQGVKQLLVKGRMSLDTPTGARANLRIFPRLEFVSKQPLLGRAGRGAIGAIGAMSATSAIRSVAAAVSRVLN